MLQDPTHGKDHVQELMNKYTEICKTEGQKQFKELRDQLSNMNLREVERETERRSMDIALASHRFAVNLLDFREFAPLVEYWCLKFNAYERPYALTRLVDLGALAYSRAMTGR